MTMGIETMFGLGKEEILEEIKELPLQWIKPYPNQPFEIYKDSRLKELVEDIKLRGLDNPILVRKISDENYQIISGHNRFEAIKLLNWNRVPVNIKNLNDEEAMIYLVQSNLLQRATIKESEKVKAYTLRSIAMKKQGQRGEEKYNSLERLSEKENIKPRTLSRYIACSKLIPELLELLDKKKISLNLGEQLAKLEENNQQKMADFIVNHQKKLTLKQVKEIVESEKNDDFSIEECLDNNLIKEADETNKSKLEKICSKLENHKTYIHSLNLNTEQVSKFLELLLDEKIITAV